MTETRNRRLPVGIQSFEKIRKDGYLYVDKTDIIWHLANTDNTYNYLSRPRRFGKLGRDTVPHHINARHFSIWCVLREISAIVLYNLFLDGTYFLQTLLLYMGEYGGWHSSYIIILSQQADQFCFQ